jgi:proline iminopeptidase
MSIPIPPPRVSGLTTSTATPLYWCAYGPAGAPKLLVVHGGPGAHHDYLLPQMLELADEQELVFYDQRGGGRSRSDDPAPIGWREHVEDLGRVATELGVDPLIIAGYSWGGLLALLYALEVRDDPSAGPAPAALALIDPAPIDRRFRRDFDAEFTRRQQGPVIQRMRAELAESGLRERDPAAYRQRAFELSVAGYFHDPEKARDLTPFRVMGKVQESVWASLGDYDLRPRLPALRGIPSYIAHGREDPIPLASSEALAEATGAELDVLLQCGHVPYVEQPASLFDGMRRFLAAQGSRR